ncbi:hemolymph lipopolysaccharide-binding protein-like [Periplaneta americana]|uniref:hemolymph lipopolysaccharide-binding protein-like n=1 Tax=Periplaneta americana TaxID=6978 RepID=UPI0037E87879
MDCSMKFASLVCCVMLCPGLATAMKCKSDYFKPMTLGFSRHYATGELAAQVTLDYGGHKRLSPFAFADDVMRLTFTCLDGVPEELMSEVPESSEQYESTTCDDPSYEYVPGLGYYKLHKDAQTWYKASRTCDEENAYLLILNSEKEFLEIKKIWDTAPGIGVALHVGINDIDNEGQFVTVMGNSINTTGYARWFPGHPNNRDTANCVSVNRNGYLTEALCSIKRIFICEKMMKGLDYTMGEEYDHTWH